MIELDFLDVLSPVTVQVLYFVELSHQERGQIPRPPWSFGHKFGTFWNYKIRTEDEFESKTCVSLLFIFTNKGFNLNSFTFKVSELDGRAKPQFIEKINPINSDLSCLANWILIGRQVRYTRPFLLFSLKSSFTITGGHCEKYVYVY